MRRPSAWKVCLATAALLALAAFLNKVSFGPEPQQTAVRNSLSLRERLRPKLAFPMSARPKGFVKGGGVWDELVAARSKEDVEERERGYRLFAFNTLVSSRLSLHRDIPDTRHRACRNQTWDVDSLPDASIVICYYREDLRTLLRTVYSVVDRSPAHLLREIIVVNDASDIDIAANFTSHIANHNLSHIVKLVAAPERLGLIRARMYGAGQATGDVLVFLDSHVEANVGWLEPLLGRIAGDGRRVVAPVIDIINADTFSYEPSSLVRGGFNWGLNFQWDPIPRSELRSEADFAGPFRSATMAGGLFAIDRRYFVRLGQYDPGLEVWGGENLELSFRVWMCGGSLEIMPCSRVGHVFRKRRPYGSGGSGETDTMVRNSLRVAHVWLDEYIEKYFEVFPRARNVQYGNVTDRIRLRERLQCKSFRWYLENIYPEILDPSKKKSVKFERWDQRTRNYTRKFLLRLSDTDLCADAPVGERKADVALSPCKYGADNRGQVWHLTDRAELVHAKLLCLDAGKDRPRLMKCHEQRGSQEWRFRGSENTAVYNVAASLCLSADDGAVKMDLCTDSSHVWTLEDSAQR